MAVVDESARFDAAAMAGVSRMARYLRILPWLLLGLGIWLQWQDPRGLMTNLRHQIFDFYQRTAPRPYLDPLQDTGTTVRFIDIDEKSLALKGQWPWARTVMAEMIGKLKDAGAKVVGFDIVFAEADRTSPSKVALSLADDLRRTRPEETDWGPILERIGALPSHDDWFSQSLKTLPVITGFFASNDPEVATKEAPAVKAPPTIRGDAETAKPEHVVRWLDPFHGASKTLGSIEQEAAGNGALNTIPDSDGIVRRVPMVMRVRDVIVPTLTLEAIRLVTNSKRIMVMMAGANEAVNFGGSQGIISVVGGKTKIPTTSDGQIWVHFTKSEPKRRISAADLWAPGADLSVLKNAVVFVGTSAAGLKDLRATPLEHEIPGVEIHAMAVEQMLLGHYLERPDWGIGAERLFAVILGLFVVVAIRFFSAFWVGVIAVVAVACAIGGSWVAYSEYRWLLDPVAPSVIVGLALLSSGLVKLMETEAERRAVRGAMSQYLPPSVVEEIARDPSKLKLGGDTRVLTLKFCDIRGFTAIAESFRTDPQGLTRLINRVLTPLSKAILNGNGTIDKYIGDCIMAFWNAPLDDPDHAKHACECALKMQDVIVHLNRELDAEGFYASHKVKRIAVGIGINTGPCVVGNMGSDIRFDYSALGDAVNLAARYQSLSGQYGSFIVVGQDTSTLVETEFAFMEIDYVIVKGRAEPTYLYALMGHTHVRETESFRVLNAALQTIFKAIREKDWAGARAALAAGRAIPGVDQTIFDTFEDRVEHYETNPPGADWTGAWKALEK